MLVLDKEALMCDLAETYHIYDFKSLPVHLVATFAVGLREDSRIKLKINGLKWPIDTMLGALAVDALHLLVWMKSKDAEKGRNRPKSIYRLLLEDNGEGTTEHVAYDTISDFDLAWEKLKRGD